MRWQFARAAVLCLAGICAAQPRQASLSRQPYLQNLSNDRVSILWTTTGSPGEGILRYAAPGGAAAAVRSQVRHFPKAETSMSEDFFLHRADLAGLLPDTAYSYRVFLDGVDVSPAGERELTFRTAGAGAFSFIVFGDSGDGGPLQNELARRIATEQPAFAVHTGDLAYFDGTFSQLEHYYFDVYRPVMRRVAFFPVPGNHDYETADAAAYRAAHALPVAGVPERDHGLYYSFDWGPVHFTAIDTNRPLQEALRGDGEMLRWLERDLDATRQPWRIAFLHHTPFATGHHRENETCRQVREFVTPILERHGVHMLLAGHEHAYERTRPRRSGRFQERGTVYVTTGGAGSYPQFVETTIDVPIALPVPHYLKIEVDGARMTVVAIAAVGAELDRFTLSAAPTLDNDGVRDSAMFLPEVAQGGLVSLFGLDLAPGPVFPNSLPLPTRLSDVTVTAAGRDLPLLFVSRGQINAQLPFDIAGRVTVSVRTAQGVAQMPVLIRETAPALFRVRHHGVFSVAVVHIDGTLVSAAAPARRGEWLAVFLTGLGKPNGALAAGHAATALRVIAPVQALVDGRAAEISFAGMAPGMVGVNQVNFRVPAETASGVVPFSVTAGGARSVPLDLVVE